MGRTFLGKVVKIIDQTRLVINLGKEDGIKLGDKFIVYSLDDEIIDPDTKENLGRLEIVKGQAQVVSVQEKMSTIISIEKKMNRIINKSPFVSLSQTETFETVMLPFFNPQVGDYLKQIY